MEAVRRSLSTPPEGGLRNQNSTRPTNVVSIVAESTIEALHSEDSEGSDLFTKAVKTWKTNMSDALTTTDKIRFLARLTGCGIEMKSEFLEECIIKSVEYENLSGLSHLLKSYALLLTPQVVNSGFKKAVDQKNFSLATALFKHISYDSMEHLYAFMNLVVEAKKAQIQEDLDQKGDLIALHGQLKNKASLLDEEEASASIKPSPKRKGGANPVNSLHAEIRGPLNNLDLNELQWSSILALCVKGDNEFLLTFFLTYFKRIEPSSFHTAFILAARTNKLPFLESLKNRVSEEILQIALVIACKNKNEEAIKSLLTSKKMNLLLCIGQIIEYVVAHENLEILLLYLEKKNGKDDSLASIQLAYATAKALGKDTFADQLKRKYKLFSSSPDTS